MTKKITTQAATIHHALATQIIDGTLASGSKLPSERELSELFSTTRITLREALQRMEAQGSIYRESRRGWFVTPPRLVYNPFTHSLFHQMVESQGRKAITQVISTSTELASPELCLKLAVPPLSKLHCIRRLRSVDGRPVMFVEHYLKPEFFPDILKLDLSQSLTLIYRKHYDIHCGRATFDIYPTAAQASVANYLNLPEGSPLLMIIRVNYDQHGQILDCDREFWRHDAVRITMDSQALHSDKVA
ncbi:UTRA domain-containing protein [Pseudomonas sp. Irchel s3h17]|uniref:UTRA domain-containing protein n=1 Tax=Pseudomonas sp. Irchel s3h17 TaxID=2009182 RepID=UPI000BA454A1|nr:UTRA domain-containing protein [Pseudomonas sp. Irchel s3h17]